MKRSMDTTQQIEPVRKSLLDVLRENLKLANRTTFIHRLYYIGELKIKPSKEKPIGYHMKKTIKTINEGFHDEPLTGIFLTYSKYFCHILEGSEDSLTKHILLLGSIPELKKHLGKMKLLVCYHHIIQRVWPDWVAMTGKPRKLLKKIDANSNLQEATKYAHRCVQKLYKLSFSHRLQERRQILMQPKGPEVQDQEAISTEKVKYVLEKRTECLPEYGLLDFLLNTKHMLDLRHYVDVYGVIPPLDFYKDKVWPVPPEFVPQNVFERPYDPVPNLPSPHHEEAPELLQDAVE